LSVQLYKKEVPAIGKKKKKKGDFTAMLEEIKCSHSIQSRYDELCEQFRERSYEFVPARNSLNNGESGFFFGKSYGLSEDAYIGKPQEEDGHILVVGGPGSGKTTSIAMPTIDKWGGIIISTDIKGEYDDTKNSMRESHGRRVKIFNPAKPDSAHYDPFSLLRYEGDEQLAANAYTIALSLLPPRPSSDENRIWRDTARSLLTGVIIYYYQGGFTFSDMIIAVCSQSAKKLVKEIMNSSNQLARLYVSKLFVLKQVTLSGVGMDLQELTPLASDMAVNSALSISEKDDDFIDWNDFLSNGPQYDVILQIPEYRLEAWEPMMTLMINQLTKSLERRPDKYSSAGKALPPILVMLDEFPRLGRCEAIKNGLTTLRSRGVTFALFVQNISQLDERYGDIGRRNIIDSCSYIALLRVTEPDAQEYFSSMIGVRKEEQFSRSSNWDAKGRVTGYGVHISENFEPIIQPHELGHLENEFILITPDGHLHVKKDPYYLRFSQNLLLPEVGRMNVDGCQ